MKSIKSFKDLNLEFLYSAHGINIDGKENVLNKINEKYF